MCLCYPYSDTLNQEQSGHLHRIKLDCTVPTLNPTKKAAHPFLTRTLSLVKGRRHTVVVKPSMKKLIGCASWVFKSGKWWYSEERDTCYRREACLPVLPTGNQNPKHKEMRWQKKQAQSVCLSPTSAALVKPSYPSSTDSKEQWQPTQSIYIFTRELWLEQERSLASCDDNTTFCPHSFFDLVKCKCAKQRCSGVKADLVHLNENLANLVHFSSHPAPSIFFPLYIIPRFFSLPYSYINLII